MAHLWETHLAVGDADYDPTYHQKPRSEILSMIARPPRCFLDVGCGGGATGALLKSRYAGVRAIGVELNRGAAEAARAVFDRVFCGDITDGSLLEGGVERASIDTVLLLDVLEHVYNPWALLCNLRPYLTPDAQVVASIPNSFNLQLLEELASGHWRYERNGLLDITHIRFFTLREMNALFEQTGYAVRRVAAVPHPPHLIPQIVARHADGIETPHLHLRKQTPQRLEELFYVQFLMLATLPEAGADAAVEPPPPAAAGQPRPAAAAIPDDASLEQLLPAGLAAYRAADLASARELFGRALQIDPANPNALHMLGVIAFLTGDPERAEQYLLDATRSVGETVPAIRENLARVRIALAERRARDAMASFSGRALAALRHRLADPRARTRPPQPAAGVDVLFSFGHAASAVQVAGFCAACERAGLPRARAWSCGDQHGDLGAAAHAGAWSEAAASQLDGATLVVWGGWPTDGFPAWPTRAARVLLVCDSADPERVIAAVNFAGQLADVPVELVCTSDAVADALGLPAIRLTDGSFPEPPALAQLARLAGGTE